MCGLEGKDGGCKGTQKPVSGEDKALIRYLGGAQVQVCTALPSRQAVVITELETCFENFSSVLILTP